MPVISDSTPLNILVRIDLIDLLPKLFGKIIIPPAVARELSHPNAPKTCREWIGRPPEWLETVAPCRVDRAVSPDPGECEAICLAMELKAHMLLVDDKGARQAAKRCGLRITGTVGVIELGALSGYVKLADAIESLTRTDFFISAHLIHKLREGDKA